MTRKFEGGESTHVQPLIWSNVERRWGRVVSKRMWLWTYIPIGLFLLGGTAMYSWLGVETLP